MPKSQLKPGPKKARILVVEDEPFVRIALCEDLRDQGFTVVEAATADEALSYLSAGVEADLLFSDVQMPGSLDGIALARRLRSERPELVVILTSGNAVPTRDLTDVLFVPKPYDYQAVAAVLLEALVPKPRNDE